MRDGQLGEGEATEERQLGKVIMRRRFSVKPGKVTEGKGIKNSNDQVFS